MMALQPKPMTDTPASLKNLVEPLPASALMGLIKVEQQQHQLPTAPLPVYATQPQNNLVKVGFLVLRISLNIQIPYPAESRAQTRFVGRIEPARDRPLRLARATFSTQSRFYQSARYCTFTLT